MYLYTTKLIKDNSDMMNIKKQLLTLFLLLIGGVTTYPTLAQSTHISKAWEIGIGANLMNWNRVSITGFQKVAEGYKYNMGIDHLLGGGLLYVAREINPWFYVDMQGSLNVAPSRVETNRKLQQVWMGGLGAQLRLSPLFKSQYVEPYFRVGVNYLHKNFAANNAGSFDSDATGEAGWQASDLWNGSANGADKHSFIPVSLGAGVNAWLNNSIGLGLQGEYLVPTEKGLPRFAQVSLRFIYRIGGKDKRPAPRVEYVEQVVEKIVERPVEVIVERVVEKETPSEVTIYDLLQNVSFEFDKFTLLPSSHEALDKLADVLKRNEGRRFLLTGQTDARGDEAYNQKLSESRAKVVMEELIKRGIPATHLRARGIGKRAAALSAKESNEARLGDRKVTIEFITNMEYWNKLPRL